MKKSLILAALCLSVMATGASAAGNWTGSLGAGVGMPTGDFGDAWGSGFLGTAAADYWLSDKVSVGLGFGWLSSGRSEDLSGEGDLSFMNYEARTQYMFPMSGALHPYVVGGLGMYMAGTEVTPTPGGPTTESDDSFFGMRGGLGLAWSMSPAMKLMAEGSYHHVMTDKDKFGIDAAPFFGITGGVQYAFGGNGAPKSGQ
jgi:hypothetical protein